METLLSRRAVAEKLGISETTIWRYCNAGNLPMPIRLGANRVAWPSSVIEAWIASRTTANGGGR